MVEVPSDMNSFYSGRHVLVTGGAGFLGKVLVEKLLRATRIDALYVLMREKKGQSPRDRFQHVLQDKLFGKLRESDPEALSKIRVLEGDIELPGLGLGHEDKMMVTDQVSVVFHCAASVRFDDTLRRMARSNLEGTIHVADLCKEMTKLEALVHVSTAYSNCDRRVIEEEVYEASIPPRKFLKCLDLLDDDMIQAVSSEFLKGKPNSYVFVKCLAENAMKEEHQKGLPVTIVRPSIICSTYQEPIIGWCDNYYGVTGISYMTAKGLVRAILVDDSKMIDLVPVDMTANIIIASAWHTATFKPKEMQVYNYASGSLAPMTWGDYRHWIRECNDRNPLPGAVWYPSLITTREPEIFKILDYCFHYLPAKAGDAINNLRGKQSGFVKLHERMFRSVEALGYFSIREWTFSSTNVMSLMELMTPDDQDRFNFDVRKVDHVKRMYHCWMGSRKYLRNENFDNLPAVRRRHKMLLVAHLVVKSVIATPVIYGLYTMLNAVLQSTENFLFPDPI